MRPLLVVVLVAALVNAAPSAPEMTNMEAIATMIAYASSAFVFLPAGRDIISYSTFLLPGEENVRPMMMMQDPKVAYWMWGMWGANQ